MENKDKTVEFELNTSEWSDNIELVIKGIQESCTAYKWMFLTAAKKSENKYSIGMYALMLVGGIAGVLSNITDSSSDYIDYIQPIITIMCYGTSIIGGILKFAKFDQKTTAYKTMSNRFNSLESDITRQLSLDRKDRVNAGKYLQGVSTEFDALFSASPLLPNNIYDKWLENNKQNHIIKTQPPPPPENRPVSPSIIIDLDKFSDGKMRYEMERLNNHAGMF